MILHFLKDYKGECRAFTEKELHDAIMEDNKRSFFNTSSHIDMIPVICWCAPVTEIAGVVKEISSPLFKDDICRTVLNRSSYFYRAGYRFEKDTEKAIWKCFTELSLDSNENIKVCENYVNLFIDQVIIHEQSIKRRHYGKNWHQFCQNFHNQKADGWKKIHSAEELSKWSLEIEEDFYLSVEDAEKKGLFEEEDKANFEAAMSMLMHVYDCV